MASPERLSLTGPSRGERLTQIHLDAAELVWIYNSTNDLLFPTAGTYGEIRGKRNATSLLHGRWYG